MKVNCQICRYYTVQVEIPDEFRKLAKPLLEPNENTKEEFERCIKAVENATGLPFSDDYDEFVVEVESAENGETMLEL